MNSEVPNGRRLRTWRARARRLQLFHAARATRSVELPTGHHPFVSRPDLVVAQLEALLGNETE